MNHQPRDFISLDPRPRVKVILVTPVGLGRLQVDRGIYWARVVERPQQGAFLATRYGSVFAARKDYVVLS
jgi:hypothetical protein